MLESSAHDDINIRGGDDSLLFRKSEAFLHGRTSYSGIWKLLHSLAIRIGLSECLRLTNHLLEELPDCRSESHS